MREGLRRRLDFWIGAPLIALLSLFTRRRAASRAKPQRILIIKLAAFGDTVLLIPVLRALRQAYPSATIDWLVSPVNHSLAAMVPYVNEVILLRNFKLSSLMALAKRLRHASYDLVVDAEQWAHGTALLTWATGAPERIGFKTPGCFRHALYTQALPKRYTQHERDDFFDLFLLSTPLNGSRELELWETPESRQNAEKIMTEAMLPVAGHPRVLLHPGCGKDGLPREWPIAKYIALGKWLQGEKGAQIFITGGPDETGKASQLSNALSGSVNAAGRLSWPAVISLVKHMNLVISGNTGVMHVAAAWKKPQIALHGPTSALFWGPLNPAAKVIQSSCPGCPCLRLGFEYHRRDASCMDRISLEDVCTVVNDVIKSN